MQGVFVTFVLRTKSNNMKVWEDFVLCYERKMFKECGLILYSLIRDKMGDSAPPAETSAILQDWIAISYHAGAIISNHQDVVDYLLRTERRLIEGPGNPTVNN